MSRQKTKSHVFNYFVETDDGQNCKCQCLKSKGTDDTEEICGALLSGFRGTGPNAPTRAANLKRHLQRHHPNIAEKVNKEDEALNKPSESAVKPVQATINKYVVSQRITVNMTEKKFKDCLIEMVVMNATPFTFFSTPAFQKLNGEMADKLGVSLSAENIRQLVLEKAKIEKLSFKEKLKNSLLFLKMDACTRHRVNYFAINVQFVDHETNKLTICTLSVKDTLAQHSSDSIKQIVKEVLEEFGLTTRQVLAIVTDNASNMVSTIEKLNAELAEEVDSNESNESGLPEDDGGDMHEDTDDGVYGAMNELSRESDLFEVYHMRCAVHTLQLAVRDGLTQRHASNIIAKIRQVAVAARTSKLDAILKRRAGKGALLDQATRWGSTYLMVKRLLELKDTLVDMANPSVALTENQWQQVKELEMLLALPFIATKNLQGADLSPGEFLKEWKGLIFKLSKVGGLIADEIVESMKRRERLLLGNEILLAAAYVDPNCRIMLNDEQCNTAKNALTDVAIRLKSLKNEEVAVQHTLSDVAGNSSSQGESDSEDLEFEQLLDRQERVKRQRMDESQETVSALDSFRQNFRVSLKEIEKYNRTSKLNLQQAISLYPDSVKEVARVVTALPPTQVSVERLFSALKLIKTDLRASLKEDAIDAILFLRTNWKPETC